MMNTIPSEEKTYFLVSEDVRVEEGGRLTILGLIPNKRIPLKYLEKNPTSMISLSLIFNEGEGDFNGSIEILDEDGGLAIPKVDNINIKIGQAYNRFSIVIKLLPFPLKKAGVYTVRIILDEKEFSNKFWVEQ